MQNVVVGLFILFLQCVRANMLDKCVLVVLVVVFLAPDLFFAVDGAPRMRINKICKQPRGDVCIEIRKCPFFSDLLDRSSIPRPRHVIKIIRDSQCGFLGNIPKVCCTLPPTTTPPSIQNETDIFLLPNVSNHQNLRLLPRSDCGRISTDFRITSGTKTTLLEFPWMALIAYMTEDGLDFRCGGTVINERYVLTAAHCVLNLTLVGVRLGEHNINTKEDCDETKTKCSPPVHDFYIEDIIIHPEYIPNTYTNDIALIRLATPANFSYVNVQPICLPLGDMATYNLDGKFAIVSGWGVTETGFKSAELLKISVPVVPNKECRLIYQKYAPISHKQICAGGYLGRDSCGGDSGGPLKYVGLVDGVPRYIQHGVVSYGPRHCGAEGQPGVYTRISFYMDWILDNLKPD